MHKIVLVHVKPDVTQNVLIHVKHNVETCALQDALMVAWIAVNRFVQTHASLHALMNAMVRLHPVHKLELIHTLKLNTNTDRM